jgi:flavin-dependent dehydrogenase
MKKILVAGAGHGGLVAAGCLARAGYNVEVVEKLGREELGYDWTDIFELSSFDFAGIPRPPESEYTLKEQMTFINPSRTVFLNPRKPANHFEYKMERKDIYKHLLRFAEDGGAILRFGINIDGPLVENGKVSGIRTSAGDMRCGLVIDACGLDSPVRSNLPEGYHILKKFAEGQRFYTYRAFFARKPGDVKYKYKIYFYHNGEAGISWAATEEKYIDILIGRFTPVTQDIMDRALEDLREDNPLMTRERIRGGYGAMISVRKPLPLFVGNGYAAVGDSAGMTIPIIGSGIANSIIAGKILADTVAKNGDFSINNLWNYQKAYLDARGAGHAGLDAMKELLSGVRAKDMDFMMERRIITEKDLGRAGAGGEIRMPLSDILGRAIRGLKNFPVLMKVARAAGRSKKLTAAALAAPRTYDADAVSAWMDVYSRI